jgi:hypothetical protein
MHSVSDRKRGRSSYEKMLVADTFLIIGCILISFGAGLSVYYAPITAQDTVTPLSIDNNYSNNLTIHLDPGDRLLLGVKPYALANLTLVLDGTDSKPILVYTTSEPGSFLNLTYSATISGSYRIVVLENLTTPSNTGIDCQIEVMSLQILGTPSRPYLVYGILLIIVGLVSLLYSRRSGIRTGELEEWHSTGDYALPSLLIASAIGFASLFTSYAVLGPSPFGSLGDILLIVIPALNVCSLLVGTITLQGRSLHIFLRALLVSIALWILSVSILAYLLPSTLLGYSYTWDLNLFLRAMQGLDTLNSTFIEIETILAIVVLAYCLCYRYGRHRIYTFQLGVESVEAGTLSGTAKKLKNALGKKDLEGFFEKLRNQDLEASVFLYFVMLDHAKSGINSFTYHRTISDRREVFSKDIYERDPAQKVLQPLGYLRVSGEGRFKIFQLRVDNPIVSRLIELYKNAASTMNETSLAKWAGVDLLKQRRMRYSGLLKEDASTKRARHAGDTEETD